MVIHGQTWSSGSRAAAPSLPEASWSFGFTCSIYILSPHFQHLYHQIHHCHCQQHHQHKQHQQDLISAPSPTSWPGAEGWTDGFGQGATWWWRSHPPQVCFAPLLLKTVSFVFDTIIVFRIRRLRLEDGGLFIIARYNRMLRCLDDSLLDYPSLICWKKILWSVGMMIVVGGVCLPRQMSRGFGNNQTEEWMFSPLGFSDKREYTFISKNRSSWWF